MNLVEFWLVEKLREIAVGIFFVGDLRGVDNLVFPKMFTYAFHCVKR